MKIIHTFHSSRSPQDQSRHAFRAVVWASALIGWVPALAEGAHIDLHLCMPGNYVVYAAFGSVGVEVNGSCHDLYQLRVHSETEDPGGPAILECAIPRNAEMPAFELVPGTAFLAPVAEFCTTN